MFGLTRTSKSDPLRLDRVPIGAYPGPLYLTICPGKRVGGIFGEWRRDLGADVARLKAYGIRGVVSMLDHGEAARLRVGGLYVAYRMAGFHVWRVPTPDGGAPNPALLQDVMHAVGGALVLGHPVVVHCRGGLGRAGTFAACMAMVADRLNAEEAMRRVRAARPGAIETLTQEAFLAQMERIFSSRSIPSCNP